MTQTEDGTSTSAQVAGLTQPGHRPTAGASSKASWRRPAVLGLMPFFVFVAIFLLLPAFTLVKDAIYINGHLTLSQMTRAIEPPYRSSFWDSIRLSVITSVVAALVGVPLAYAATQLKRPKFLRDAITSWCGVAANFGGIPLAFAFIAALGVQGLITRILDGIGINLSQNGFLISDFEGLVVVYMYFQIPLMVIVMLPAVDGLRQTWREAATNLGASPLRYWRHVGLPVLGPAITGGVLLLFANSFSAYATAYALSGGKSNVVPLQIKFLSGGNVQAGERPLAFALATWMILIMFVTVVANVLLQRRTAKWVR